MRVSNKKLENLGSGLIENATVKIKGHSFSVNGFVNSFTSNLWGAYDGQSQYGSQNFEINLRVGGDIPTDPEKGLTIEDHPPSPGYDFFNLTFTPIDGVTVVAPAPIEPNEELKEVKTQPSVQKASTSLPEQGKPSFFSAFDETTGLYYGMECLTTEEAKNGGKIDWELTHGLFMGRQSKHSTPPQYLMRSFNLPKIPNINLIHGPRSGK